MDPLTHALSGIVIRQIGFRRNAALFVLVFSAIAPDLDYVTRFWGTEAFLLYHRGITHGILALAVFPLLMGLIFRNRGGFFYYYFLSLLAYGSHILFDLTNQYGTMVLSPLDWNRYSLDLTSLIDPCISATLLAAVIIGKLNKKRSVAAAVLAVLIVAGYLGGRSYLQDETRHFLKTRVDANIYKVYPLPNGLLRWWFVTKSGNEATTGVVDLFMDKVFVYKKYNLGDTDPAVAQSKRAGVIHGFLSISKEPYAEVRRTDKTTTVIWRELSYSFLPGDRFTAKVVMDKRGKIIDSGFRL